MEMEQMRQEFKALEKQFSEVKNILSEVHTAIVGNPLTRDGGLVARITSAEEQLEQLKTNFIKTERRFEERIVGTEKKQIRYNVYTIVMWVAVGGSASMLFAYILQLWFKK